jgi:hypothetical protein
MNFMILIHVQKNPKDTSEQLSVIKAWILGKNIENSIPFWKFCYTGILKLVDLDINRKFEAITKI